MTRVIDSLQEHLPVTARQVETTDPVVTWFDESWSLTLACPWFAEGPSSSFTWESDTLEDDVWELVGRDLVRIEVADDLVDPVFHFSGSWTVRVEADTDVDPWVLRLPGATFVGTMAAGQ